MQQNWYRTSITQHGKLSCECTSDIKDTKPMNSKNATESGQWNADGAQETDAHNPIRQLKKQCRNALGQTTAGAR